MNDLLLCIHYEEIWVCECGTKVLDAFTYLGKNAKIVNKLVIFKKKTMAIGCKDLFLTGQILDASVIIQLLQRGKNKLL